MLFMSSSFCFSGPDTPWWDTSLWACTRWLIPRSLFWYQGRAWDWQTGRYQTSSWAVASFIFYQCWYNFGMLPINFLGFRRGLSIYYLQVVPWELWRLCSWTPSPIPKSNGFASLNLQKLPPVISGGFSEAVRGHVHQPVAFSIAPELKNPQGKLDIIFFVLFLDLPASLFPTHTVVLLDGSTTASVSKNRRRF